MDNTPPPSYNEATTGQYSNGPGVQKDQPIYPVNQAHQVSPQQNQCVASTAGGYPNQVYEGAYSIPPKQIPSTEAPIFRTGTQNNLPTWNSNPLTYEGLARKARYAFYPTGQIAFQKSQEVKRALAEGDIEGARLASQEARKYARMSFLIGKGIMFGCCAIFAGIVALRGR